MFFGFQMLLISVSLAAKTVMFPLTLCLLFEQKDIIHPVDVLIHELMYLIIWLHDLILPKWLGHQSAINLLLNF